MCSNCYRNQSGRDHTRPEPTNSRGEYVGGWNPPGPGDERPQSNYTSREKSSYDSWTPSRHDRDNYKGWGG
jgi:hypothetical protein